jgi:hypothetical protein
MTKHGRYTSERPARKSRRPGVRFILPNSATNVKIESARFLARLFSNDVVGGDLGTTNTNRLNVWVRLDPTQRAAY